MFPPGSLPPGVYESEDHSEVTSPLSIAEWLVSFHREARKARGCREGICRAGEILYVPSGTTQFKYTPSFVSTLLIILHVQAGGTSS